MDIWVKIFKPTNIKDKRLHLMLEKIPLPDVFTKENTSINIVYLEPGAEAGNHFHTETSEVIVGLGTINAVLEDPKTKERTTIDLNPKNNKDMFVAIAPPSGIAHKVINYGSESAIILDIATTNSTNKEIFDYKIK